MRYKLPRQNRCNRTAAYGTLLILGLVLALAGIGAYYTIAYIFCALLSMIGGVL